MSWYMCSDSATSQVYDADEDDEGKDNSLQLKKGEEENEKEEKEEQIQVQECLEELQRTVDGEEEREEEREEEPEDGFFSERFDEDCEQEDYNDDFLLSFMMLFLIGNVENSHLFDGSSADICVFDATNDPSLSSPPSYSSSSSPSSLSSSSSSIHSTILNSCLLVVAATPMICNHVVMLSRQVHQRMQLRRWTRRSEPHGQVGTENENETQNQNQNQNQSEGESEGESDGEVEQVPRKEDSAANNQQKIRILRDVKPHDPHDVSIDNQYASTSSEFVKDIDVSRPAQQHFDGTSGAFVVFGFHNEPVGIFKSGLRTESVNEFLAYDFDCISPQTLRAGVPPTVLVSLPGEMFSSNEIHPRVGSLSKFIPSLGGAGNFGNGRFTKRDIERIGVFDMRMVNMDRHSFNLLCQAEEKEENPEEGQNQEEVKNHLSSEGVDSCNKDNATPLLNLIPIDHDAILPSLYDLSREDQQERSGFEWMLWQQSKEALSPDAREAIRKLDIIRDVHRLKDVHGISADRQVTFVISNTILQEMATGSTTTDVSLFEIASHVQRSSDRQTPCTMERIFQQLIDEGTLPPTREELKLSSSKNWPGWELIQRRTKVLLGSIRGR